MKRGFYTIMAAQFFSALADHALFITALAVLKAMAADPSSSQFLKSCFTVSFVMLAPFVGAFADSLPKGRVMLVTNTIKIVGCIALFAGVEPLFAYALVGFGAAAYSPAKYGILTELLEPHQLVAANGWIEGLTVAAIVSGAAIGGVLIHPYLLAHYAQWTWLADGTAAAPRIAALLCCGFYVTAAVLNLGVPRTEAKLVPFSFRATLPGFGVSFVALWKDRYGRVSLAVTSVFWGAAGALQVLVLNWAEVALHLPAHQAPMMQLVVAVGTAIGAVIAARTLQLRDALKLVPVGIAMGAGVLLMLLIDTVLPATLLLFVVGCLAGFFLVPMNALLQHRGHQIMTAGRSISVQNFNENACILGLTLGIGALQGYGGSVYTAIIGLGCFVAISMVIVQLLIKRYRLLEQSTIPGAPAAH